MTGDAGGAAQPFYFPLLPHYYGLIRRPATVERGDTVAELQRRSAAEGSVRIHRLSKAYGKAQALKEVSLLLAPGQCCALLGANGSGEEGGERERERDREREREKRAVILRLHGDGPT